MGIWHTANAGPVLARLAKPGQWVRLMTGRIAGRVREPGLAAMSMDLVEDPVVALCLGARPAFHSRFLRLNASRIVGWGRKRSGRQALALGARTGLPVMLLEDGFLRSVGRRDTPVSLVVDAAGIYYDAGGPSSLEAMIGEGLSSGETARARRVMALWNELGLSKYNAARDYAGPLPQRYVLVVDQTPGDASIRHGMANAASFTPMLEAALADNPDAMIVLKAHPDTARRGGRGHFDLTRLQRNPRILLVTEPCHPVRLIADAEAVYTVTSQLGFEALIRGKRVHTFGMGFYAGWGLTVDALPPPARRGRASLEQLVHAALVRYPRCVDLVTMARCEVERAMAHVALQRRQRLALPDRIRAFGFSRWKWSFVRSFLPGSRVAFGGVVEPGEAVAVWGSTPVPDLPEKVLVLRMEDGFLRSSGLGAELVRPLSLVIDDLGIHYDATQPSRLERLLSEVTLDADQLARAQRLRRKIVDLGVTKYNLGPGTWTRPPDARQVVLVVGQVETDASIRLGSPEVRTNLVLLRRVRAERPQAHVLYKPHPDVAAGLRGLGKEEGRAREFCDEVIGSLVASDGLLGQVDEVHTMTSLMGFEALLRGVRVVCHGLPFYAGWGLTEDRLPLPRRTRRLTVDELVFAALVLYPRYLDDRSGCFIEAEEAVDRLAEQARLGPRTRGRRKKARRWVLRAWKRLRGAG